MAIEEAYVVVTLSRATDSVTAFPFATRKAAEEAVKFLTRDVGIEALIIDDHDEQEPADHDAEPPDDED